VHLIDGATRCRGMMDAEPNCRCFNDDKAKLSQGLAIDVNANKKEVERAVLKEDGLSSGSINIVPTATQRRSDRREGRGRGDKKRGR